VANLGKPPCDEGVILSSKSEAPCAPSSRPWILAATIIGSSMAFIDSTVTNVALPALQRELGATAVDAQWVVESYSLLLAALILVGGSLGDHYGRKRIYMLGIALFALASVGCGMAMNPGQLIVARVVQGIGGALLTPEQQAVLESEKVDLAGAAVPEGVDAETSAAVERAVDEAFVGAFRLAMYIAAGLAMASALAAAVLIEGKGQFEKPEEAAKAVIV
jgi:MFS family permease